MLPCMSSKMKIHVHEKYLQIMYLVMDLHPQYKKQT